VTTKVWNSEQGYDAAIASFEASLDRLGLEVLDLLLIHWPVPDLDRYVETWHAFEKLYADGRVRAIGVSNFHVPHLQRLLDEGSVVPAVNQIELHPQLPQDELRAFHAQHGIITEAWSPLARGGAVLSDPTVVAIAERVGKSPAQVVLRWSLQLGNVVLPRSVTPSRIAENLELFDFSLVDPDNRRDVDFEARRRLLAGCEEGGPPLDGTGAAKLWLVRQALRARREHPELLTGYRPMLAAGPAARHAVAFDRGGLVSVATRLPVTLADRGGWQHTELSLPAGEQLDLLTGTVHRGTVPLAELLARYPVALMRPA